jgi:hypothetical protein
MTDPNKLPEHNEAQKEDDPKPPHKGSKWRKKAGTDEAYEPTPPPDKVPHLTDFDESKQDADDEDEDRPLLSSRQTFINDDSGLQSNAPNLTESGQRPQAEEADKELPELPVHPGRGLAADSNDVESNAPDLSDSRRYSRPDEADKEDDD